MIPGLRNRKLNDKLNDKRNHRSNPGRNAKDKGYLI